jgi:acetone carboxylase gamma subunit
MGKNVIEALEMMKDYYPNMSIEATTESERRKLACSYCDYIEEFEVLKQTPEYKSLEEAYKNRAR